MTGNRKITWTKQGIARLKAAHEEAVLNNHTQFELLLPGELKPIELHTGYAKYLLEYLEPQMLNLDKGYISRNT